MIPNNLKTLWQEGRPTINGWLSIGSPFSAEIMAAQGYDSVTIDVQHGALDYGDVLPMFQAMRAAGVTLMARTPWREPGIIMKLLDAGAYGIICPMVNTPEEAAEFVSFVRYPPVGQRSFGPTRVSFAAGANYAGEANAEILAFVMIETQEAFDNVAAIAATPGLDGLYIGPADLTFSLARGRLTPAFDREEEEMIDAIKRILAAAKGAGIKAALHCGTADYAAKAIGWGFDMTTVSGDSRLLAAAAAASVKRFRELTASAAGAGETGAY
jgi:4-hydroxy-2-oxoheptanedioate aldolase